MVIQQHTHMMCCSTTTLTFLCNSLVEVEVEVDFGLGFGGGFGVGVGVRDCLLFLRVMRDIAAAMGRDNGDVVL